MVCQGEARWPSPAAIRAEGAHDFRHDSAADLATRPTSAVPQIPPGHHESDGSSRRSPPIDRGRKASFATPKALSCKRNRL